MKFLFFDSNKSSQSDLWSQKKSLKIYTRIVDAQNDVKNIFWKILEKSKFHSVQ